MQNVLSLGIRVLLYEGKKNVSRVKWGKVVLLKRPKGSEMVKTQPSSGTVMYWFDKKENGWDMDHINIDGLGKEIVNQGSKFVLRP